MTISITGLRGRYGGFLDPEPQGPQTVSLIEGCLRTIYSISLDLQTYFGDQKAVSYQGLLEASRQLTVIEKDGLCHTALVEARREFLTHLNEVEGAPKFPQTIERIEAWIQGLDWLFIEKDPTLTIKRLLCNKALNYEESDAILRTRKIVGYFESHIEEVCAIRATIRSLWDSIRERVERHEYTGGFFTWNIILSCSLLEERKTLISKISEFVEKFEALHS